MKTSREIRKKERKDTRGWRENRQEVYATMAGPAGHGMKLLDRGKKTRTHRTKKREEPSEGRETAEKKYGGVGGIERGNRHSAPGEKERTTCLSCVGV